MSDWEFSPKFRLFLDDYARRTGKSPSLLIEEAVSQSILRHEAALSGEDHSAFLMPGRVQTQLLAALPEFDGRPAESSLGEFMEHLPDHAWSYQACRVEEWWFLIVSKAPRTLPEPLELRSTETSQAYAWLFGFTKTVRLWSAPDRFLVVF